MPYRLLLAVFLCLSTFVPVPILAAASAAEPESSPRVLVLGDSLSAAYNMPSSAGWVALLRERLDKDATVINAAISGDTTAGARARLAQVLDRHNPSLVIIALGGNDGLRGVSLDAFRENLNAMITAARQSGAEVLLAGVRLPSNYGTAFIERFLNVYEEVASARDVAFVPKLLAGVAEDPELMQADGIHPNQTAQPIILENIWQGLLPLLDSAGKNR
ncbi:MAG: arylesterase [Spiribacter sp.]|jgi:acyl-CoA thioesterase-1|nr:arylesterase [Spiribacter sp.]MDR9489867.1 arylesterase [Spiribacter sp.]